MFLSGCLLFFLLPFLNLLLWSHSVFWSKLPWRTCWPVIALWSEHQRHVKWRSEVSVSSDLLPQEHLPLSLRRPPAAALTASLLSEDGVCGAADMRPHSYSLYMQVICDSGRTLSVWLLLAPDQWCSPGRMMSQHYWNTSDLHSWWISASRKISIVSYHVGNIVLIQRCLY